MAFPRLIVLFHLRVIFVMLQLKMLNISFCIAQALLLCAKYCLPALRTYLTIRPVARKEYGSIAHEAKPNGLLTRGP